MLRSVVLHLSLHCLIKYLITYAQMAPINAVAGKFTVAKGLNFGILSLLLHPYCSEGSGGSVICAYAHTWPEPWLLVNSMDAKIWAWSQENLSLRFPIM